MRLSKQVKGAQEWMMSKRIRTDTYTESPKKNIENQPVLSRRLRYSSRTKLYG